MALIHVPEHADDDNARQTKDERQDSGVREKQERRERFEKKRTSLHSARLSNAWIVFALPLTINVLA